MQTKNLKKNFIWNLIGSLLSALTSLLYLVIVTRINGVDPAGIFSFGFAIACLLYYIGIYAGRVFQVTENSKVSDKSFFIAKIISVALMLVVSIIYLLINHFDPFKFLVILSLCIYRALEAFVDVFYGYFQKYNDLYLSGISMTIKAVVGTLAFTIIDLITHNIFYATLGIVATYILVIIFFDFHKSRKYHIFKTKANKSDIISIFKVGFFPFALIFLSLMVLNSPKYAIDALSTNEIQAHFGIIVMPATVISLAAQFIVYPFLTSINEFNKKKQFRKIDQLTSKIILCVLVVGALSTIAAFAIGINILELIYNVNLSNYRILLAIIMIAATLNACVYVYLNILISLRKFKLQTITYAIVALLSLFIARILVKDLSIDGACYAYLLSIIILTIPYYIITKYTLRKLEYQTNAN